MKVNRIVVLTDKDLPTDHSFIQGVMEKVLPAFSQQVTFVGFGKDSSNHTSLASYKLTNPWSKNFAIKKLQKLLIFTKLVNECKPDVLFTRNDPVYLIIAWILKLYHPKLIHVHQISHLHAYSTTLRKKITFRVKASGDLLLRRIFISKADLILLISEEMHTFLSNEWKKHAHKFQIYPLGVLSSEFKSSIPLKSREMDIGYIGTLSKSRELYTIVDGLEIYNQKYGNAVLHIWGQSHDPEDDKRLKSYVKDRGLSDKIKFYGRVSRAEVMTALKQIKIGLSVIPPKGLLKQISPTKLMEYMASGCFIIASRGIKDQDMILSDAKTGIIIDFDSQQLATALKKALDSIETLEPLAQIGQEYILKHRSYETMGQRLLNDIEKVRA